MNRTFLALVCILLLSMSIAATTSAQQKMAYVDIATIMKEIPEAQEAQRQLDALVDTWQKELQDMENTWQAKFNDYDKRKLILTDQGRARAEKELQELDQRIMQYRDQKFGQNGELFREEDRIMRPIQDIVFDQVRNLGVEQGYDYVFDKSGGVMIIYAKDEYDLTKPAIERIKNFLPARQAPGEGGTARQPTTTHRPSDQHMPPEHHRPPEHTAPPGHTDDGRVIPPSDADETRR